MTGVQPDQLRSMLNRLSRLYFTAAKAALTRPGGRSQQNAERQARDLERRLDRYFDRQERETH